MLIATVLIAALLAGVIVFAGQDSTYRHNFPQNGGHHPPVPWQGWERPEYRPYSMPYGDWRNQDYWPADQRPGPDGGFWRGVAFALFLMVVVLILVLYFAVRH